MWGKESAHGPTFKVGAQGQGAEAEGSEQTGSIRVRGTACWLLAVPRLSPRAGTDPKREARVPGHQMQDEGVSAKCAGKWPAGEGRGGQRAFPRLLGGPRATRPLRSQASLLATLTPLPPEAASARLSATRTQIFPSPLKYRSARVVVLELLKKRLLSAPLGGAGSPCSSQGERAGLSCFRRKPSTDRAHFRRSDTATLGLV